MKAVSQTYKDNIKQLGKELTYEITYTSNGTTTTLGDEDILNANLHYEGGILKSVMKQLDLELYNDLALGTELTYKFGVKTGDSTYEKINYGTFIVYSSEKQENSNTYKLVCYDKMLNTMKDYEKITSKNLSNINEISIGKGWANTTQTQRATILYIPIERGQEYTLVSSYTDTHITQVRGVLNNGPTDITNNSVVSGTFTTPSNQWSYISIEVLANTTFTNEMLNGLKIMLCKGTATISNYVPYLSYPITLRDYTTILSDNIGLRFSNANGDFCNYDKILNTDLYIDNEGKSLGYTYRDVLNEIAEATASIICINNNNELEIRYLNNGNGEAIDYEILGNTTQDTTPSNNMLPNDLETRTENGITITKNDDGTYTLNGTATADVSLAINNGFVAMSGTWKMLGCPSGGSSTTYMLSAYVGYWGTGSPNIDTGDGTNITYTGNVKVRFYIKSGTTCDNLIFKPMLTTDTSTTTFEPYTGNVPNPNFPRKVINETGAVELELPQKNLCPNNLTNGSLSGITYFKNSDGSIKITGTASARVEPDLFNDSSNPIKFKAGTYKNTSNRLIVLYGNGNYYSVNANATRTFTSDTNITRIYFRVENGESNLVETFYPQIIKNGLEESYVPYTKSNYTIDLGDLELCKIGTYRDKIFKASGKNLFDYNDITTSANFTNNYNGTFTRTSNGTNMTINTNATSVPYDTFSLSAGTYSVSFDITTSVDTTLTNFYLCTTQNGTNTNIQKPINISITANTKTHIKAENCVINNNAEKVGFVAYFSASTGIVISNIQVEEGSSSSNYEPYGNYWYKYKAIKKLVIDGSEVWTYYSVSQGSLFRNTTLVSDAILDNSYAPYCNFYRGIPLSQTRANNNIIVNNASSYAYLDIVDNRFTTEAGLKAWLSNNNVIIYYVLAIPTYERITGDLEKQLNNVKILEVINAEYFKDINVNFGEVIKPINTITLKRSAGSDAISLSKPENLQDDLKNEIAISENQILNNDDRYLFLEPLLNRLYGTTYAINDYISTGITWLELGDKYNVRIQKQDTDGNVIDDSFYTCVMLNDEIDVNQGLNETIHTDLPEESKTDYNTTTKTDRLKKRTDLIVNKQDNYIEAITGTLGMDADGNSEVINGIITKQNENELNIKAITSYETINGVETLTGVKTGKGFTFNNQGLIITDVNEANTYKTKIDETGTYYYDGTTPLAETTNEGSKFKNMDLFGEFRYGKDDINDNALFVSMKFTDTDTNEECFGHFWNGN